MPQPTREAGAWNGEEPGAVLGAAKGDAAGLSFKLPAKLKPKTPKIQNFFKPLHLEAESPRALNP